jgi:hypothetical protein
MITPGTQQRGACSKNLLETTANAVAHHSIANPAADGQPGARLDMAGNCHEKNQMSMTKTTSLFLHPQKIAAGAQNR